MTSMTRRFLPGNDFKGIAVGKYPGGASFSGTFWWRRKGTASWKAENPAVLPFGTGHGIGEGCDIIRAGQRLFVTATSISSTATVGALSTDGGETWTAKTYSETPTAGHWKQIAYRKSDGVMVVCGGTGGLSQSPSARLVMYSLDDGESWAAANIETFQRATGVVYAEALGAFFLCGFAVTTTASGAIWRSYDGVNWDRVLFLNGAPGTLPLTSRFINFYGLAYAGGRLMATGFTQATVGGTAQLIGRYSDDGENWGLVLPTADGGAPYAHYLAGDGSGTNWVVAIKASGQQFIFSITGTTLGFDRLYWSLTNSPPVGPRPDFILGEPRGCKFLHGRFLIPWIVDSGPGFIRKVGLFSGSATQFPAMTSPDDQDYQPMGISN